MLRTSGWAHTWSALRVLMALAIIVCMSAQLTKSVTTAATDGKDVPTTIANFFSFFTILSNVSAVIGLLWAAIWFWTRARRDGRKEPRGLATFLACSATYMIITGLVYNLLLRGITLPQGSQPIPWSNETLHVVGPIFLLLDVFLGPRRRALPWRSIVEILVFPLVWTAYTLIRGPLTTNPATGEPFWYPYPFLNPNNFSNGYVTVSLYVVAIAIAFALVAAGVVWVGHRRNRTEADAAVTASTPA
jgi:hypothetical protein